MIRATLFYADGGMRETELSSLTPVLIVPEPRKEIGHVDDVRFVDVERVLSGLPSKPVKPFPRRRFKLDRYEPSDESAVYIEEAG